MCAQVVSLPAHTAKLAAQAKRVGRSTKPDIRQVLAERLEGEARAGVITRRADVVRYLKAHGFSVSRQGVNYLTVECPGTKERVRLKGNIFREHFCPRDLQRASVRRYPAHLLVLERRLERLVEKRATYHRARYGIKELAKDTEHLKDQDANHRTRNSFTHRRSAFGEVPPRPSSAVWGDPFRLDEATQYFRRANHSIECAAKRLDQADRAFARDYDQALTEASRMSRTDALVQTYGLQLPQGGRQPDVELELEL
jgi:hypothetical protein